MNQSLSILLENLRRFDLPDCEEWHDSLIIELPQGFLRYRTAAEAFASSENMSVVLEYSYKVLAFTVQIADVSEIGAVTFFEHARIDPNQLRRHGIEEAMTLTLEDAKELFGYLQRNFACFKISVRTRDNILE